MRFIINAIRSNVLVGIIGHGVGIKREMVRTLKRGGKLFMRAAHPALWTLTVHRHPVGVTPAADWAVVRDRRPAPPVLVPVPTC